MNPLGEQLSRRQRLFRVSGWSAVGLCVIGAFFNSRAFFEAYLVAYLIWLGIALGCLAILMIHHLAGGRWGFVVRRVLEAANATLPLMAVLFIPVMIGMYQLYPWMNRELVAGDVILQHKRPFLNQPFFIGRAVVYLAIWAGIAIGLDRASTAQDRAPSRETTRRLTIISGAGLGLYVLTMTFASFDWAMSLEPHWFSSMYGVLIMTGQVLSAFAFLILMAAWLVRFSPYAEIIEPDHFHDLGNFLLTFVIFWAYIAFSQFLIIWSGNLPEENSWYLRRLSGGWREMGLILVVLQFFTPAGVLLSRTVKRRSPWLGRVAWVVLLTGFIGVFWTVAPGYGRGGFVIHWMDVLAPVGLGGIWFATFLKHLQSRSALPVHDSRVEEELEWA